MLKKFLVPFALALALIPARPDGKFALTIDNIMRGPGLVGYEPAGVRWSGDSQRVYFQWKQASDPLLKEMDTYVVNRDGSGLRKLSEQESRQAPPETGAKSRDKSQTTYVRDGDIFLYRAATGETRQITKTSDVESNPHFLPDGHSIYFMRANNLYVMSLDTGYLEQMTDIRPPGAPGAPGVDKPKGTDSQEFVKKEEKDLLEIVREQTEKHERDEARRKREHPRKPFILQARQSVATLELTPDGKSVLAGIAEAGEKNKATIIPVFVTESAYTEEAHSRDKVGDIQSNYRLAMLSVETGEVKWLEPPVDPKRPVQLTSLLWSDDGGKAVLMARAADNKDRWILGLDAGAGKTHVIFQDHDDRWIGGPGMFTLGWMKGDHAIYFQSERSGYSHLYTVSFDGGEPSQLTSGNWEVTGVHLSRDKSRFYLTTSKSDPGEHQLYEMSAQGGTLKQLTHTPGNHATTVSPDEEAIADVYSYSNKPPELFVQDKKVTTSPAPDFFEYPWLDTPIATFQARDGARVRAHVYKPANYAAGGPAIIFVHGAGYLQNVHRGWSNYFREYMFHHLLMERGFLVTDIDYRGSAGYGRDWRTAIYEHMGGQDLDDQVDAAKWLVSQFGVNPKKIGIYGGSYGGFITLMAMFTQPDVFAAGAALRPVTDWAHYNHPYTANILNLPQNDPDAYRRSSPIYFANGLKGALLICHGMVDTNVHFQDTVRLVQKLIELRKPNWNVAVYPVENHGFVEPASWADEYKRILALFQNNLN